jgi:hypothetical protein
MFLVSYKNEGDKTLLTIDDFWKILKFLESGQTSDPTIDQNLTALAQSEKSKTEDFFEKILDIKPFLSMDYGRLRKFLVDWYSSHKTLVSTQKQISDIFSLPEQSLSELVQSFGYVSPIETLSFNTKINFFLDLVNLYKVKGSPLALERVLTYFGLNNIQLVEFWLMRDSDGELIFRPEVVTSTITDPSLTDVTLADITFEEMVSGDPHWMLTRNQIEQSLLVNSIGIPSISPYFSIYGYFNVALLLKYITILVRKVQDEYQEWVITHSTPDEIVLKLFKESSTGSSIKIVVSVLEVYLSAIYLWNLMQVATGGESSFLCYAGTSTDLNAIFALYDSLMTRTFTRLETKTKYETFMNVFTRPASSNFLITKDTAGAVLNLINPTLKTELDSWSSSEERAKNAIVYLLNELSTWYQQNISKFFPNLANITLGIDASTEVMMAINFFKPYRARVRAINIVNIQKNPALDSVITEDRWAGEKVTETIIDFDTADCLPGVLPDWVPIGEGVTSNPPIGARRIYNIYVDATHTVKAVSADATSSFSIDIVSSPPVGCYRVTNVYLQDNITIPLKLKVIYNDTPEPVGGIPTPLTSGPPYSLTWPFDYLIYDMYIDSGGNIFITYNSTHNPALADPGKKYYPRNTYDTGAYFDIGISCDEPPTPMDATAVLWLGEDFVRRIPRIPDTWTNIPYYKYLYLPETSPLFRPVVDHYCGHPTDATSYVDIYHEPGSYPVSEPSEWFTDGGFYNRFDEGGYFDQPFPSDICCITVTELTPPVVDVIFSTTSANQVCWLCSYLGFIVDQGFGHQDAGVQGATSNCIRFPNVTIPAGATIVYAFVRFTSRYTDASAPCNVNCYFNDVDNAVIPANKTAAQGLVLTAPVAWNNIEAWIAGSIYDSPELKTILQSIIDRPGWNSGQAVSFVGADNSSPNWTGRYNQKGSPKLHVRYSP